MSELDWPGYSGQPLSYQWTISELGVFTHTLGGISDTISLSWSAAGLKSLQVTVTGGGISASATRLLLALDDWVYLPVVTK